MTDRRPILVVEDDTDIREALMGILAEEGYAVLGAADGRQALDVLRDGARPTLILLDLMMPFMNGWQFRAEQKLDAALSDIPVVVISADANVKQKAESLDAVGYLKKPVELDALLEVVQRFGRR
jgi:CheY-like chemotaxis protein